MLEPREDLVDRRQGLQLDIRLDLAFNSETQGFRKIFAIADERAANADAFGDHVKER